MSTWRASAACEGEPPDLFYDPGGAGVARAICARCPVAEPCLIEALATAPVDDYGIRAGLSRGQRARIRRERAALRRHLETAVAELRAARARRIDAWAARRRPARPARPSTMEAAA